MKNAFGRTLISTLGPIFALLAPSAVEFKDATPRTRAAVVPRKVGGFGGFGHPGRREYTSLYEPKFRGERPTAGIAIDSKGRVLECHDEAEARKRNLVWWPDMPADVPQADRRAVYRSAVSMGLARVEQTARAA